MFISSQHFDTSGSYAENAVDHMQSFLFNLPRRSAVFIVVHKNASTAFNKMESTMAELGANNSNVGNESQSYCFAGYKGSENVTWRKERKPENGQGPCAISLEIETPGVLNFLLMILQFNTKQCN